MSKTLVLQKQKVIFNLETFLQTSKVSSESPEARLAISIIHSLKLYRVDCEPYVVQLIELLKQSHVTLLSPRNFRVFLRKFTLDPNFFEALMSFSKKLKRKKLHRPLWKFYVNKFLCQTIKNDGKSRYECSAILISWLVKELHLSQKELIQYALVFRSILDIVEKESDPDQLLTLLKGEPKSSYHFLLERLRFMIDSNSSAEATSKMICLHFISVEADDYRLTDSFQKLTNLLDEILHPHYMGNLQKWQLFRLYQVHIIQPALFEGLNYSENHQISFPVIINDLLTKYKIPFVLSKFFSSPHLTEFGSDLVAHCLSGKNIVYYDKLPFKLTKKMAHVFQEITFDFKGFNECDYLCFSAFYLKTQDMEYAQEVTKAIVKLGNFDFWLETLTLWHQRGLVTNNIKPVVQYFQSVVFDLGIGFNLKTKTLDELRHDILDWEHSIRTLSRYSQVRYFPSFGANEFEILYNQSNYCIDQVRTNVELYFEGKTLKHCVYSYEERCVRGESYIFSLYLKGSKFDYFRRKLLVTIEVCDRKIVQARGLSNRKINTSESHVIKTWAETNNLFF